MQPHPVDAEALDVRGLRIAVAGLGTSGWAAADVCAQREAHVVAFDRHDNDTLRERGQLLGMLGGKALIGHEAPDSLPQIDGAQPDLVITSPGWRPDAPALAQAALLGIPIWSEVELAWRLRQPKSAPWACVTGTNGKTTTVRMAAAMAEAAGLRVATVGNVGTPVLDAIVCGDQFDLLIVELSSFQLHHTYSMSPESSVCLNVADDHLDWHGGFEEYAAAKARIYENTQLACVYNVDDPRTEKMVEDADVIDGARAIGFTLGTPGLSMFGLVDDVLCDRAFVENRSHSAAEIATLDDVGTATGSPPAPHNVANALAAAALIRAHGVPAGAIRHGLRAMTLDPHRIALVAEHDNIRWVDDSKATNAHAAQASLLAVPSAVWVAGGLAKGAAFDELVSSVADRLRAVVLIGTDVHELKDALGRHAADVPVIECEPGQNARVPSVTVDGLNQYVDDVVAAAAQAAQPGDTVLLAPACASMDQFTSYIHRGELFEQAVHRHINR